MVEDDQAIEIGESVEISKSVYDKLKKLYGEQIVNAEQTEIGKLINKNKKN